MDTPVRRHEKIRKIIEQWDDMGSIDNPIGQNLVPTAGYTYPLVPILYMAYMASLFISYDTVTVLFADIVGAYLMLKPAVYSKRLRVPISSHATFTQRFTIICGQTASHSLIKCISHDIPVYLQYVHVYV